MTLPEVATCEQWLEARKRLLTAEITETRRRDALSAERRRLPTYRIEKEYLLEGSPAAAPIPRSPIDAGAEPAVANQQARHPEPRYSAKGRHQAGQSADREVRVRVEDVRPEVRGCRREP
jgi:Bacterial protein of unknown function (DUF899)